MNMTRNYNEYGEAIYTKSFSYSKNDEYQSLEVTTEFEIDNIDKDWAISFKTTAVDGSGFTSTNSDRVRGFAKKRDAVAAIEDAVDSNFLCMFDTNGNAIYI